MRRIIAVHFGAAPAFTAQENHPDADRFQFGANWVDAIGGRPTQEEVDAVTKPTFSEEKAALIEKIRAWRKDAYNALIGIGFAAREENDTVTVQSCLTARSGLKGIEDWPDVAAATTMPALQAALIARYNVIRNACPDNVKTAFAGLRL